MWFPLKGDARLTRRCATEGCGGQPTWRLEAGGVGSDYCPGCKAKIEMLRIVRENPDDFAEPYPQPNARQ